jgi:hypothetical protein
VKLVHAFALFSALSLNLAHAQTVAIADLGELELRFTAVSATDAYPGNPVVARAGFRPGEANSLVTPHRVQQITYLAEPGSHVTRGQAIARLSGPEIHHFMTEFEVIEERLAIAKKRFDSNRALYDRRAIDEGRWVEVSEAYYALRLEYEHMRHFRDIIQPGGDDPDSLLLLSPAAGLLQYRQDKPGVEAGKELALIIPETSLRLHVSVPLAQRHSLTTLSYGDCAVAVTSVSGIAEDYFVSAWSEAIPAQCPLLPGERLMVTPRYSQPGYLVPRTAVMEWAGRPAVLLQNGESLQVVPVGILGSAGADYFVRSDMALDGASVLSSSVSAVQGVLLGLGGE